MMTRESDALSGLSSILALIFLVACSGFAIPIEKTGQAIPPSPTPIIVSPTPVFVPTATMTGTVEATSTTITEAAPTNTATQEVVSTLTATPFLNLVLKILNCNTSIDIIHQMGEVTNAFPRISNIGTLDASNVCATLSASDEAREHPDKTKCIPSLPAGFQVTFKLTVDTGFQQDTSITIKVSTQEGSTIQTTIPSCREISLPGWNPGNIDFVEPIP